MAYEKTQANNLVNKLLMWIGQDQVNLQWADFKNIKTTKQELHQEYFCFLDEQFYFDQ